MLWTHAYCFIALVLGRWPNLGGEPERGVPLGNGNTICGGGTRAEDAARERSGGWRGPARGGSTGPMFKNDELLCTVCIDYTILSMSRRNQEKTLSWCTASVLAAELRQVQGPPWQQYRNR